MIPLPSDSSQEWRLGAVKGGNFPNANSGTPPNNLDLAPK